MPKQLGPIDAKYVFLDVEAYSPRAVGVQVHIIAKLNELVRSCLADLKIGAAKLRLLPTGDGICVAFLSLPDPADADIQFALLLLSKLKRYNDSQKDSRRRFTVRVGLNENADNLVEDINGRPNLAGAGINLAQRIMSLADGGQILVGPATYARLQPREPHQGNLRRLPPARIKHDEWITIYQYIKSRQPGLECNSPRWPTSVDPERYVELMDRHQMRQRIGERETRIESATLDVRISGIHCSNIITGATSSLMKAMQRNPKLQMKIMCLDKHSPAVPLLPLLGHGYNASEDFLSYMKSIEAILASLRKRFPRQFQYRFTRVLPVVGLYIIDPHRSMGLVKVEIYTASSKESDIRSRPHFVVPPENPSWRKYFLNHWDFLWDNASEPVERKSNRKGRSR